jgi:hypothetical protein
MHVSFLVRGIWKRPTSYLIFFQLFLLFVFLMSFDAAVVSSQMKNVDKSSSG